jgi:integrase/recombinase XerD
MALQTSIRLNHTAYRELANGFYTYLTEIGYNSKSNKTRYYSLCEFLCRMESLGLRELSRIRPCHIQDYYGYIATRPNKRGEGTLDARTAHRHMQIINLFFLMLQQQGIIGTNPCSALYFPYPKESAALRQILTREEICLLYAATESPTERAVLSLGYGCGLRSGEMQACDLSDIRFREKILIVPKGKGNKRRIVPLSKGVITGLLDYFHNDRQERRQLPGCSSTQPAFMLNSKGGRMKTWTFNSHLKAIIERTGNDRLINKQITVHALRYPNLYKIRTLQN